MTLLNPFLVKLMKGCPIMMHNGYILPTTDIRYSTATLFRIVRILSTISTMWVRTSDFVWLKKKSFDRLFVKSRLNTFFVKVFIEVWPWENIGDSGVSMLRGLLLTCFAQVSVHFDKIFTSIVWLHLIHISLAFDGFCDIFWDGYK